MYTLLSVGVDVDAQGGEYGNALQAISVNGYTKVVSVLLDAGADVNALGGRYHNALSAALVSGHKKAVLNAGAQYHRQGIPRKNAENPFGIRFTKGFRARRPKVANEHRLKSQESSQSRFRLMLRTLFGYS